MFRYFLKKISYFSTLISPVLNTQLHFLHMNGKLADLKNPVSFAEKISWLKLNLYANDPLVKQCADKYLVRDYVAEKGFAHLLNPLYGVYNHPEEIDWSVLPNQFVLKWNFGCGFNLLCSDKDKLDQKNAMQLLKQWERNKFWLKNAELQYKTNKRLLCERYMNLPEGEELLDYKVYCFHGTAKAILVMARPNNDTVSAIFMSPEWELLSDIPQKYKAMQLPSKPINLTEMLLAAQTLAGTFPFVRIDFYEYQGQLVFGEMTFTPSAGINPSETNIDGKSMGSFIHLERQMR